MKRLILYDLDGTLVDTGEDIANAANYMIEALYGAPLPPEVIRRFVGQGLHDLVKRCLDTDDPARIRRGLELFEAYYTQHLTDYSTLYPSTLEVLHYFGTRSHQAVLTNKPDPFARNLLTALGVADYFVEILAGGSRYPKKPDPTAARSVMERCQVGPEETLLVGDSAIDVETGRNAGILTVIVAQGFAQQDALHAAAPDVLVQDLEEFLQLARQRGW